MASPKDGHREHLGCWLGSSESLESWGAVCADLTQRGLTGVRYVVSDEHQGLLSALRRFFPDAVHQRCQVHSLRNALAKVSGAKRQQQLLAVLRNVWAAPTRVLAQQRLATLIASLRSPLPALAEWLETTAAETLAVYALPPGELRRRLRTTNSIEHEHGEMQRRDATARCNGEMQRRDATARCNGERRSSASSRTTRVYFAWEPRWRSNATTSGSNAAISTPRSSP